MEFNWIFERDSILKRFIKMDSYFKQKIETLL